MAEVLFPLGIRDFSSLYRFKTGSVAHSVSNLMGMGAAFPSYSGRGVKLTTHLHLELRSRTMELYIHFIICLHGVELN
jgi:hypothetical protein